MTLDIELRVRFVIDDAALNELHNRAFGRTASVQPWAKRLERHSLSWVGAFDRETLVGFVNLCWDGGAHAFVLDTAVHPEHQRRGIGSRLIKKAAIEATRAGCEWLHVDYEPRLQSFYRNACGFRSTDAGLLPLIR